MSYQSDGLIIATTPLIRAGSYIEMNIDGHTYVLRVEEIVNQEESHSHAITE